VLLRILARELGDAPVVRTDDFATGVPTFEWWPRVVDQVLRPLVEGRSVHYQRYDWDSKRFAEWHPIAPEEFLILEGVSASRLAFRPFLRWLCGCSRHATYAFSVDWNAMVRPPMANGWSGWLRRTPRWHANAPMSSQTSSCRATSVQRFGVGLGACPAGTNAGHRSRF
jgi:hypothetical protein